MPEIRPFRGLRYASDTDLPLAVAPPYDVIDARERSVLADRPHNVVRLILPEPGEAGDRYAQAAALLQAWRNSGILAVERRPAFYVYAQTFAYLHGERLTRAGVIGAVQHGPTIWGHERTHQGPKDDRLRLLKATRTNLSPIFGLVDDRDGAVDAAVAEAMTAHPVADFTDAAGVRQQLWVVTDAGPIERIRAGTRAAHVIIADGHHRFETSVTYREEVGGPGSDAVMMMCVSLRSEGLRIYPYHRVLETLPVPGEEELDASLGGAWSVERLMGGADVWPQIEARLAELQPTAHAFALHTPGVFRVIHARRAAHAQGVDALDVTVLQQRLFEAAWNLDVETLNHEGAITYTPYANVACTKVHEGSAQLAVLVNPTPTESVVACARGGKRMPQKSTYFHPKLLTGLVMRSLSDDPA